MKKELYRASFILALIAIFVSVSPVAMAENVGSPTATVVQGSFQEGAETDLWEKDMEVETGDEDEVESEKILVKGTYGISDKIDVFAKVGMADAKIDDNDFEFDMDIAYEVEGKVNVYEKGQIKADVVEQNPLWSGNDDDTAVGPNIEIDATEFDLAFGGNYEVSEAFNCYGGLMYAMVIGEMYNGGSVYVDESYPICIFLGGEYTITPHVKAGLELRQMSETSFTFMTSFAF
jgi:hypothetical protein